MTRTTRTLAAGPAGAGPRGRRLLAGRHGGRGRAPRSEPAPTPDADVPAATTAGALRTPRTSRSATPTPPRRWCRRPTSPTAACGRPTTTPPWSPPGCRAPSWSTSAAAARTAARWSGCSRPATQPQPPQFDALTKDTDLVTVGIGGNDFNLFGTLIGTCVRLRASDPHGCALRGAVHLRAGPTSSTRELRQIRGHVAAIVDRHPGPRAARPGGGRRLPADRARPTAPAPPCCPSPPATTPTRAGSTRAWPPRCERGARKADDYVDTFGPSAGHDICSDDPWINGQATDPSRALAFHPFAAEQEAVARLVLDAL